jgi:hypothetical protein
MRMMVMIRLYPISSKLCASVTWNPMDRQAVQNW